MQPSSLERLAKRARALDEEHEKRSTQFQVIPTRASEAVSSARPVTPLQRGHDVMDRLRALCDSLDTETKYRSPNQRLIQNRLSGGIARLVYGPDMNRFEKEIRAYNNFTTIRQESATTMPRRSGKSDSIGKWVSAAMLAVPDFDGACFANSARAAGKEKGMLGIVLNALMDNFGIAPESFTINNKECIQFLVGGNRRTFHSYPGACHTLRGVGGNVIIVEESAYVTDLAFRELIIPLMALGHVCFVALSTLGQKTAGWFNRLVETKLVDVMVVQYVCEACRAKGIVNPCIHCVDSLPHWGSEERVGLMQKMYGEENRDVYLREVMGIVKDEGEGRVFNKRKIREALTNPPVSFDRAVSRIFVTVDPIAGSEVEEKNASDFAIVAISEPYTTILGLEALNIVDTAGYRDTLKRFLTKLRDSDEYTQDATLVIDVEMGTGFTAPDVYAFAREHFVNIETVTDKKRKEGTLTTHEAKQKMMELTREVINNDEVRFWKKFVTSDPNPAALREEWARQMCEYRRLFVKGNTVRSHNTYVLSGKGENKDQKDDLSLTFQRGLHTRWRYENDPDLRSRPFH